MRKAHWQRYQLHGLLLTGLAFLLCTATESTWSQPNPPEGRRFTTPRRLPPQAMSAAATPYWHARQHTVGNIMVAIDNAGSIGQVGFDCEDLVRGGIVFPKGTNHMFSGADLWIGGVREGDTLVTSMYDQSEEEESLESIRELWADAFPQGVMQERTNRPSLDLGPACADVPFSDSAVATHDLISVSYDTLTDPNITGVNLPDRRRHRPLGLKVTTESYSWSYEYARDFVIIDYTIENIGVPDPHTTLRPVHLTDVFIGLLNWGGVYYSDEPFFERGGFSGDDLMERIDVVPLPFDSLGLDTMNMVWSADNDGNPVNGSFNDQSLTSAVAIRPLRPEPWQVPYSFNWWTAAHDDDGDGDGPGASSNWGPVRVGSTVEYPGGTLGWPRSDVAKYQLLSNGEHDYPQMEAALDHQSAGWLSPHRDAAGFASGARVVGLHSFGPIDLPPGAKYSFTVAVIGGEHFHESPFNYLQYFDPYHPEVFRSGLDFDDLLTNARWAMWMFDTPGFDTDGDGYFGRYRVVGLDTIYYRGDGVPDFTGPPPPPAPLLRFETSKGQVKLHWNGRRTETTADLFTNRVDFEGYRVYMNRTGLAADWVLMAQRDLINYDRHTWNPQLQRWEIRDAPFKRDSLKVLYDTLSLRQYGFPFEPDSFSVPIIPDALMEIQFDPLFPSQLDTLYRYFTGHDINHIVDDTGLADAAQQGLAVNGVIRKLHPRADPSDLDTLEDGSEYLPFYEYEFSLDELQVAEPVFFAVTAFDQGDPATGLLPLESSQDANRVDVWPINSATIVERDRLKPGVYPNPYRTIDDYKGSGWENPRGLEPDQERTRKVTFYNVPDTCTVTIWSIDGDLVRKLDHRAHPSSSDATVVVWDLITRNTQAVKTGIYIWAVESRYGTDVGKLVIIK